MEATVEKHLKNLQWLSQEKNATKDDVRGIYDNWAAEYDGSMPDICQCQNWKQIVRPLDVAVSKAFPDKGKDEIKIIDVAAGTGLTGVELNKLGYTSIDALDISQEMLNEANKKDVYKRFICTHLGDQHTSEIQSGEYDALTCVNALGNKHILPTALEEMCRIVSKGKKHIFVVGVTSA
ncbi:Methyltransferase domain [Desmophyllum pertusum]|uniref:Methyltransferase domain n=1 Tax=Desmophyllum pertusum TaxID=174260 RepID=A0A9W9ZZE5_9CNID|nr:Methyltransferase domain [Desmophyllum pertusum]